MVASARHTENFSLRHVDIVHEDHEFLPGHGPEDAFAALLALAVDQILRHVRACLRRERDVHWHVLLVDFMPEIALDVDSFAGAGGAAHEHVHVVSDE